MTKYEDLTEMDRLNVCDIAWFIKGYRAAKPECALEECHETTLLRIANAISNRPKENDKTRASCGDGGQGNI
jgi:hypothetical protein